MQPGQPYMQPGQPYMQPGLIQPQVPRPPAPPAAGAVLALIASVLGIVATVLYNYQSSKYNSLLWGTYLIGVGTAIAALAVAGRPQGRWLRPFVLGLWGITLSFVPYDVLALAAFHEFANGARYSAAFVFSSLSDVTGAVATIVLLATLRAQRGGLAKPPALPVLLVGGTVLAWIVWQGEQARKLQVLDGGVHSVLTQDYPTIAYMVVGAIVALLLTLYAVRLADRVLGGSLILGWTVASFLFFLEFTVSGFPLAGRSVAVNWLVGLLAIALAVLGIVYTRRKQSL
jgi:hypothetical protein